MIITLVINVSRDSSSGDLAAKDGGQRQTIHIDFMIYEIKHPSTGCKRSLCRAADFHVPLFGDAESVILTI